MYNSTRNVQCIYFLSTIKPQLGTNRETCEWRLLFASWGQGKSSNNNSSLCLLLGVVVIFNLRERQPKYESFYDSRGVSTYSTHIYTVVSMEYISTVCLRRCLYYHTYTSKTCNSFLQSSLRRCLYCHTYTHETWNIQIMDTITLIIAAINEVLPQAYCVLYDWLSIVIIPTTSEDKS